MRILGDTLPAPRLQGLDQKGLAWGDIPAAASAFIWARYSLLCNALLEVPVTLNSSDWLLMELMGLGSLGQHFSCGIQRLKAATPAKSAF